MGHEVPAALGVYKPRRPQASPLFRLVSDHSHQLQTAYDERFAREYGPWRPVVAQVMDRFLACGILEHGFARIRCDACAHEYLLAFSCKCRYFCPSCHAKRIAIWAQWLDTTLLAPVPHRQVVLTIPKRLRVYCLYRRRLLGEIAHGQTPPAKLASNRIPASSCFDWLRPAPENRGRERAAFASVQSGNDANTHQGASRYR
jgi:Transposase zinc-binding domain